MVFRVYRKYSLLICLLLLMVFPLNPAQGAEETEISLNFRDTEIQDIFRSLSEISGVNIVCDDSVTGTLTLNLEDVTFIQAVELVTKITDYEYKWMENTLLVGSGEIFEEPEPKPDPPPPDITEVLQLKHAEVEDVQDIILSMFQKLQVSIDSRQHHLILKGPEDEIDEAKEVVEELDKPSKQVLIEVEAVIVSHDDSLNLGTQMERGLKIFKDQSEVVFDAGFVDLHEAAVETEILARPSLVALDGKEANLMIGERIPFKIEEVEDGERRTRIEEMEAGIHLSILPRIIDDQHVLLNISPEISTFEWREGVELPQVSTRELDTTLQAVTGETFGLGGLIKEEDRIETQKIPLLGELPLLELIFSRHTREKVKSELFIFITPHIIDTHSLDFEDHSVESEQILSEEAEQEDKLPVQDYEEEEEEEERDHTKIALLLLGILIGSL